MPPTPFENKALLGDSQGTIVTMMVLNEALFLGGGVGCGQPLVSVLF